jgi:hypothetical protein
LVLGVKLNEVMLVDYYISGSLTFEINETDKRYVNARSWSHLIKVWGFTLRYMLAVVEICNFEAETMGNLQVSN